MSAKETHAERLKRELNDAKGNITEILYKNIGQYLVLYKFTVNERDPTFEKASSSISVQFAQNLLGQSSTDILGNQAPILNIHKQLDSIESGLLSIDAEIQQLSIKITNVMQFNAKVAEAKKSKLGVVSAIQLGQSTSRSADMAGHEDDETKLKRKGSENNLMKYTSGSEWSSDSARSGGSFLGQTEMKDEVDIALSKCLEDQSSLKKLRIEKVQKGVYRLENKEYKFRLL